MKTVSGPAEVVSRQAADELASDRVPNGCTHQRVDDFYCSRGVPFFAAVISTCRGRPPTMATCVQHSSRPRSTLVTLVGDLDSSTIPLLQTCMTRIDGNVEVDCSGLDFVGARGVQVLMEARARCERSEATFELLAPTPVVRRRPHRRRRSILRTTNWPRLRQALEGHRDAWIHLTMRWRPDSTHQRGAT